MTLVHCKDINTYIFWEGYYKFGRCIYCLYIYFEAGTNKLRPCVYACICLHIILNTKKRLGHSEKSSISLAVSSELLDLINLNIF